MLVELWYYLLSLCDMSGFRTVSLAIEYRHTEWRKRFEIRRVYLNILGQDILKVALRRKPRWWRKTCMEQFRPQRIQPEWVDETLQNSHCIIECIKQDHSESDFMKDAKVMELYLYDTIPTAKDTGRLSWRNVTKFAGYTWTDWARTFWEVTLWKNPRWWSYTGMIQFRPQKIQPEWVDETLRNSQGILGHIKQGHSESIFMKGPEVMELYWYDTIPTAKDTARVSWRNVTKFAGYTWTY